MTSSWQALSICHPSAGDAALGRAQCRGTKYSHPQIPSNAGRMNEDFRPFFRADRRASSSRSTTRSKSFSLARRTICATRKAADQAPPLSIAPPLFDLAEGQSRMYHELRTGLRLEVIFQLGQEAKSTGKPPIVFIHGSYHAAWCWAVYWLPFFSNQGHDCYAISLPGHGGSDTPSGKVAGDLQSHARDVAHFIQSNFTTSSVLVGHSFGGLVVQFYLSQMSSSVARPPNILAEDHFPKLAAAILLCSVPPTGNGGIVQRYIMSKPITAIKITLSLAAKAFANSLSLCRESFFSADMPDDQVKRYQDLLRDSCRLPLLDIRRLSSSLPVAMRSSTDMPPVLVVGAEKDLLVDHEGVCETQRFYAVEKHVIPEVAHDVMLDVRWETVVRVVARWIDLST